MRIMWRSQTGVEGNGSWIDGSIAEVWLKRLTEKYPQMTHWLEVKQEV